MLGGVRHGRTLGSPVAIEIKNSEWFRSDKWHEEMSPAPGATKNPLTQVRPGHADLVGMQKYGFTDARDVLERASARETAARVAAGALARRLLEELGIEVGSHVVSLGGVVCFFAGEIFRFRYHAGHLQICWLSCDVGRYKFCIVAAIYI